MLIAKDLGVKVEIIPLTTKQLKPFLTYSKVDLDISTSSQIQHEPIPSGSRRLMRRSYRELLRQRE